MGTSLSFLNCNYKMVMNVRLQEALEEGALARLSSVTKCRDRTPGTRKLFADMWTRRFNLKGAETVFLIV